MRKTEFKGLFGPIVRFTQPNKYICSSLADFLENKDSAKPTDRSDFCLAAAFNGFSLIVIEQKLIIGRDEEERTHYLADIKDSLNISLGNVPFGPGEQSYLGYNKRDRIERGVQKLLYYPKFFYQLANDAAFLVDYKLKDPKRYKNIDLHPPSPFSPR